MQEENDDLELLCARLTDDHKPLRPVNELQAKTIAAFLVDPRIHYVPLAACPLCGHRRFITVARKEQFGIPCTTVCCRHCGLLFSNPRLDDPSTALFYDEYYRKIYEGVTGPSLDHGYYKRLFAGGAAVPGVPAFVSKRSTVLEIGCGGGWNLLPYKNKHIDHYGFDYDSAMIDYGKTHYGLNLSLGGAEDARRRGITADYIILSHVLEHANDPVAFLQCIAVMLNPGGLVRITVPAIDYVRYFGGSGTSHDIGLVLSLAHNFTFSERTLALTIKKAGLTPVIAIGGFCLARAADREQQIRIPRDSCAKVLKLLENSEKYLPLKNSLMSWTPGKLRRFYPYLHLVLRPLALLRYFIIMRTGFLVGPVFGRRGDGH